MFGSRDKGITMSEVIGIFRSKLSEVGLLEESIGLNAKEIEAVGTRCTAILSRMEIQRQLVHGRAVELQELLDLLESFTEEPPPKMDA